MPEKSFSGTGFGGRTWTRNKFIDADTGFTDVVVDPRTVDKLLHLRGLLALERCI